MNQCKYTTEDRKRTTISLHERKLIEKYLRQGLTVGQIASSLGRHRSSIYRELKKGSVEQVFPTKGYHKDDPPYIIKSVYFHDVGQREAEFGALRKGNKYKLLRNPSLIEYIEDMILVNKQSPDAIIGRLRLTGHDFGMLICPKTIYNYIDKGFLRVKNIDLLLKCRRKPKIERDRTYKRKLGRSIEERPEEANNRSEFGHFEGDSIVGKDGKSSILSIVERKTGKGFLVKVPNKEATTTVKAIKAVVRRKLKPMLKSITFDNGSEFSSVRELENKTVRIYFAHPYSAWERGSNENYNGIVRRFIPKGKDMTQYSQKDLDRIADWINSLPRKRLNYRTPDEAFAAELVKL